MFLHWNCAGFYLIFTRTEKQTNARIEIPTKKIHHQYTDHRAQYLLSSHATNGNPGLIRLGCRCALQERATRSANPFLVVTAQTEEDAFLDLHDAKGWQKVLRAVVSPHSGAIAQPRRAPHGAAALYTVVLPIDEGGSSNDDEEEANGGGTFHAVDSESDCEIPTWHAQNEIAMVAESVVSDRNDETGDSRNGTDAREQACHVYDGVASCSVSQITPTDRYLPNRCSMAMGLSALDTFSRWESKADRKDKSGKKGQKAGEGVCLTKGCKGFTSYFSDNLTEAERQSHLQSLGDIGDEEDGASCRIVPSHQTTREVWLARLVPRE